MVVLTADGKALRSQGVRNIKLTINNAITVGVLAVDSTLLGFDLILGMDIIKGLGRVRITKLGYVKFTSPPICAALRINRPYIS